MKEKHFNRSNKIEKPKSTMDNHKNAIKMEQKSNTNLNQSGR